MKANIANMTPEQREENRQKGVEVRKAKVELAKAFKQEYADEDHWRMLASKYGVRLPQKHIHNSEVKYIKRACKKLGVDTKQYLDHCGANTLVGLVEMNTDYLAYAEVGLVLEYYDSLSTAL